MAKNKSLRKQLIERYGLTHYKMFIIPNVEFYIVQTSISKTWEDAQKGIVYNPKDSRFPHKKYHQALWNRAYKEIGEGMLANLPTRKSLEQLIIQKLAHQGVVTRINANRFKED